MNKKFKVKSTSKPDKGGREREEGKKENKGGRSTKKQIVRKVREK